MKEFKLIAIQMCCSYSYAIKVNMNKHVASVHEGKKPYKCDFCDHSSVLNRVTWINMRERSHSNVTFVIMAVLQKGSMKWHVAAVHGSKKTLSNVNFAIFLLHKHESAYCFDASRKEVIEYCQQFYW